MSALIIGGEDSREKRCQSCQKTGGVWNKLVIDGRTIWVHECGAKQ